MVKEGADGLTERLRELERAVPDTVSIGSTGRLRGERGCSPSKSYTHRAIMVGGLGRGCVVENALVCADTVATNAMWNSLGAESEYDAASNVLRVKGFGGRPKVRVETLDVGEAGTLLRLVLPGVAQCEGRVTVDGSGTIRNRPNSSVVGPLKALGVDIQGSPPDDRVPITIHGCGPILCGEIRLDASRSSQAVSGFLLWAPTFSCAGGRAASEIVLEGDVVSRPYIDITLDALRWAGIEVREESPGRFTVPGEQVFATEGKAFRVGGDYSSAAFVVAAACLTDSDVTLAGLLDDSQGDRAVLEILTRMGAKLSLEGEAVRVRGPVELKGIELDCGDTPDLVPVLAALACFADSPSRFMNVEHLKIKESDRLAAPAEELGKLGARIRVGDGELSVEPAELKPARVSSRGDHRLAMALIVAGLRAPGTEVEGVKSILKSYPTFVSDMRFLGGAL